MRARFIVASSFFVLIGCRESPSAEARASAPSLGAPEVQPTSAAPNPASSVPLAKTVEDASFRIDFEAPTAVKVGEAFPVVVKLSALSGYKVNQEYPIKFALEGANFSFNPAVLKKEQLTLAAKTAELKGQVTATAAGEHALQGKLSFSVCTEERCLIEKRELMVKVNAT
jgi:hypothetical protein